jgi:protein associated with RNAse G/E
MRHNVEAIKDSFEKDYKFAGLLHLYTRTCNMLYDENRIDVLDFACDVLIFVERITDSMQHDEENVQDYTRMICEHLSQIAGKKAKEVIELIENISVLPPFPPSSLRSFLQDFRSMDQHIQLIQDE